MLDAGFFRAPIGRPTSVVINPASYEALGQSLRGVVTATAPASAVWPVANLSIGYHFSVPEPTLFRSLYVINGAAVSGNVDAGIYDSLGTLIVSKGSTAQAGTSVKQILDITDTWLWPNVVYYKLTALDNTTGALMRWTATQAALMAAIGCVQVASNFPLATGVTFALLTNAYLPVAGLSQLATY